MSRVYSGKQRDKRSKGAGHPVLFGFPEAKLFEDFPEGGGYPNVFLKYAYAEMGVDDPNIVLHVCSGSVNHGYRVDVRKDHRPSVVADGVRLPFRDNQFFWILADPPYSAEYAGNLYGTGSAYPSPHVLAEECIRVLAPGGRLGFLHFMVPKVKRPGRILKVFGISQGMGYNIRAWSVFTKEAP